LFHRSDDMVRPLCGRSMPAERYVFEEALEEGLIISRPNRFIMNVSIEGQTQRCHCPTTGRIGDIVFRNVPCLVQRSNDTSRSTWGTVEAVSLDPPGWEPKTWIGIDQGRANDFVAHFVSSGQLDRLVGHVRSMRREVKAGDSRIDFLINDEILLEVKTPLQLLKVNGYADHSSTEGFTSFERTMRHFTEIAGHIPEGKRGIVLLCCLYDAPRFRVPPVNGRMAEEMQAAVRSATMNGLENWQVNLKIDRYGVGLLDCFKLDLFGGEGP
jgi:sugar fermentation stimulation protein A